MLGHFKPRSCKLSQAARDTYQRAYCTLCAALRQQFGLHASLLLNHEITMLLIAFLPEISKTETPLVYTRCPTRLWLKHQPIYTQSSEIQEAANFTLLLAWFKAVDRETDQPGWLNTKLRIILERMLDKCQWKAPTHQLIQDYALLTRKHNADLTEVAKQSATLASHVAERLGTITNTVNTSEYTKIFAMAGTAVPFADHLLDVSEDVKTGAFNPILTLAKSEGISIDEAFGIIHHQYQDIIQCLRQALKNLTLSAPIFTEIVLNSTDYLTARIAKKINNDDDEPNKNQYTGSCCDSCDDCCDCSDCIRCGKGAGQCDCSNGSSGDCCSGGDCCSNCCSGADCCGNCSCDCG